jgi:hypothetical protein
MFIYVTPIVTNLGFVNIIVVVVRLQWFSKRFKGLGTFHYYTNEYRISSSNTQQRKDLKHIESLKRKLSQNMSIQGTWKADLLVKP